MNNENNNSLAQLNLFAPLNYFLGIYLFYNVVDVYLKESFSCISS